jgi:hypothetical protein
LTRQNQPDAPISQIYPGMKILHVSGSFSAHHQEFIHCTLGTGIYHTGLNRAFEKDHDGTAVHLVGFIIKKFVTMQGHMNVKK